MVQNFAIFTNRYRLASAKIKTARSAASTISLAPRLPVRAGAAKIKTTKISSGTLRGDSVKFCSGGHVLLQSVSRGVNYNHFTNEMGELMIRYVMEDTCKQLHLLLCG